MLLAVSCMLSSSSATLLLMLMVFSFPRALRVLSAGRRSPLNRPRLILEVPYGLPLLRRFKLPGVGFEPTVPLNHR